MEVETDPRKRGFGKTVLVVDDNATIRELLATAFLSNGFKTCGEAADGKEATELAQKIEPDMITMDLSMPNMNGLEASSVLRKRFSEGSDNSFHFVCEQELGNRDRKHRYQPRFAKDRACFHAHRQSTRTHG